jgi:nucleolar protein 15
MQPDAVHEELFKGADRKFRKVDWAKLEMQKRSAPKTEKQLERGKRRAKDSLKRKQERISKLGLDYSIQDLQGRKKAKGKAVNKTEAIEVTANDTSKDKKTPSKGKEAPLKSKEIPLKIKETPLKILTKRQTALKSSVNPTNSSAPKKKMK